MLGPSRNEQRRVARALRASKPQAKWGFVYDYPSDHGGGYSAGEFLLLADGGLLRRHGTTRSTDDHEGYVWTFKEWVVHEPWASEPDASKAAEALRAEGYSIVTPSPVPYNRKKAGPFPGIPEIDTSVWP